MGKEKATKHEIFSLVGQFQHAAKIVRAGRTFVACMYSLASKRLNSYILHKVKCIISIILVLVVFLSQ